MFNGLFDCDTQITVHYWSGDMCGEDTELESFS